MSAERLTITDTPAIRVLRNISYREGPSERWVLDVVMPAETPAAPRPGIMFVHGGGWHSGDKGGPLLQALPFAVQGYVCISPNYRLSAEAPFPAAVEDVKCALRWFRAHADELNLDPQKIGATGISAGGHLSCMLGLASPDAGLEGDGPYPEYAGTVQAVAEICGPTDFTSTDIPDASNDPNAWRAFLAGPDETFDERNRAASPMHHVTAAAPPFLIIHGTADETVPVSQADALDKALRNAGNPDVTYMRIDDASHSVFGEHFGTLHPALEDFFKRTLQE